MIIPAKRTTRVTYAIRDLVVEAQKLEKQGKKILYLNIGDPGVYDYEPPEHMHEAVVSAKKQSYRYGDSMGLVEAREAVANDAKKKGIDINFEDVMMSNGASESIMLCMGALLNPNDNILTPLPGYPLYNSLVNFYGGELNNYELDEDQNWEIDVDSIRKNINEKTKGIVVINPNNPTGAMTGRKKLQQVVDICGEHNIMIFADEIYDKLVYNHEEHVSLAAISKDVPTVTFNGLSKNYLVPGWRVGWGMFSGEGMEEYKGAVAQLARMRLSSVYPKQFAVKPALEGNQDHLSHLTEVKLLQRRNLTYKRLNEIEGITCVKPKGAFYAFPKIDIEGSDKDFVVKLLHEKNVLVVHGSGFGQKQGTKHFRVVFLPDLDTLNSAYDKIEDFMKSY